MRNLVARALAATAGEAVRVPVSTALRDGSLGVTLAVEHGGQASSERRRALAVTHHGLMTTSRRAYRLQRISRDCTAGHVTYEAGEQGEGTRGWLPFRFPERRPCGLPRGSTDTPAWLASTT